MKRQYKLDDRRPRGAWALLLGACATALPLHAADWPLARRDASSSGVAESELPDQPEVLWTYRASEGAGWDATGVVADGILYIGDTEGTFHAIRLADGSSLWKQSFDGASFGSAAAIDAANGRLFIGDLNGVVRALALAGGEELWRADLGAEVYSGPMLHESNVLVTCESGSLAAFDAATGEEQWKFSSDAPLRCTPTVAAGQVMLAGCDSKLRFIDPRTSEEMGGIAIDGPTGCTAAVHDSRVYFGAESGTFFAIDLASEETDHAIIAWTYRDPRRGQPIRAAAAVDEQIVVYGSQGKAIYGLDPKSGEERWKLSTRTRVESSPVIAGNRVVAATTGGIVYLLDASTGKEIWKHEAGGNFVASPIVVDGQIILGNGDGTLYSFGEKQFSEGTGPTND